MEGMASFAERVGIPGAFGLGMLGMFFWFLKQILPIVRDWLISNTTHVRASTVALAAHTKIVEDQRDSLRRLAEVHPEVSAKLIDAVEEMMCPEDIAKVKPHLDEAKRILREK